MSDPILQQLMHEVKQIKEQMATKDNLDHMASKKDIEQMVTKDDLNRMASKKDIEQMATKSDLKQMATKTDLGELEKKLDRNHNQIVLNTEKLEQVTQKTDRHEKILESLSLRSNEQESEIRAIRNI